MPTRLLGSTTLLNQDCERLANSMIEPFNLCVAGYLKSINPACVDAKQGAVCTVFD
jgi:hypothetical protein